MNTTTAVVGTAALVTAGRWAQDKPLDMKIVIGAGVLAISLSVIQQADADIANKFAWMIFLLAAFRYLPTLVEKMGMKGATPIGKKVR